VAVAPLWKDFVVGNRIPLLGSFDLGNHELGHLITSPFGEVAAFFIGSGLKGLAPLGLAGYSGLGNTTGSRSGYVSSADEDSLHTVCNTPTTLVRRLRIACVGHDTRRCC